MVDKTNLLDKIKVHAEVAELADALRSGRSEPWAHEGSNPSFGTTPILGVLFLMRLVYKWYNCCNCQYKEFGPAVEMKKILKDKRIIVVALVIILVFLLVDFNQRMVLLSRLRSQEKSLMQKYSQLESTRIALETQIAFANSDQAVEKWAREEAGMAQEGDIPIVLLPPSSPISTPIPESTSVVDKVEKWQIWQELFFGE